MNPQIEVNLFDNEFPHNLKEPSFDRYELTQAIFVENTSFAFLKTVRTSSAADIEAYFFLSSGFPVGYEEPTPCTGSKMLFLIFLKRS